MKIEQTLFDDYEIGAERTSFGRTITETDIVVHAGHIGDFFPHHVDAQWAASSDFGQRIAHGTLVFGVAAGLTIDEINPASFSYGYDRLRFASPVFIGDTLTVKSSIADKRDDPKRPNRGFVDESCVVSNQRSEVVMVFTHVYSVARSDGSEGALDA